MIENEADLFNDAYKEIANALGLFLNNPFDYLKEATLGRLALHCIKIPLDF